MTNYTPEQVELLKTYPRLSVPALSKETQKSERSVIAKLTQLGLYKAKDKPTSVRVTKMDMIRDIAQAHGVAVDVLASVEKADRSAVSKLHELLTKQD